MQYTLIRSSRRTLALQVSLTGELFVRAPLRLSVEKIELFITEKQDWIKKHQEKYQNRPYTARKKSYSPSQIADMKERLLRYITPRVREIWEKNTLPTYTSIKITKSEGRWGSCSGKNSLCFSYRLAEYLKTSIDKEKVHREESSNVTGFLPSQEGSKPDTNLSLCTSPMHSPFIDAIITHELAHLREKNHQKPFWDLVYRMMPNYEKIIKNKLSSQEVIG